MSVTSIGGDASQRWQILKESRANPSADSSAASAASRTHPKHGPLSAVSPGPAAPSSISSASAKAITDLKALLINLQADPSGNAGGGAATGSTSVQSGLKSLLARLAKVGGDQPARQSADPEGAEAPDGAAADATKDATAAAGQTAPKHPGGLLDQVFDALAASVAPSNGSAKATTSLKA